jgi:hypothetical protein
MPSILEAILSIPVDWHEFGNRNCIPNEKLDEDEQKTKASPIN